MILFILSFAFTFSCISALSPIVNTLSGIIVGETVNFRGQNVDTYLGIRYATPPIGELRFRKPVSIQPWDEPMYATRQPPSCVQYSSRPLPWYEPDPRQNEDCLFLNVWVPVPESALPEKLAVIYWVYGGAYRFGSISLPVHNSLALAAVGNVIVVTVNYRVGPFGFLCTNSTDAGGNMGLYDVLEGLKWTYNNIETFGGDRNSITIAGESAGAVTVGALVESPTAKPYFARAIIQSGVLPADFQKPQVENINRTRILAKMVGCEDESTTSIVNCLKNIDAEYLVETFESLLKTRSVIARGFDETSTPTSAATEHNPELLIGTNRDEASAFLAIDNEELFGLYGEKFPQINKSFGINILNKFFSGTIILIPQLWHPILQHYFGDVEEDDYNTVMQRVNNMAGDLLIQCPTMFSAEKFAQEHDVYQYFFDHLPSNNFWAPRLGVTHYSEVEFVFGRPVLDQDDFSKEETDLSISIMRQWTDFAKRGIPENNWPKFTAESSLVKVLNVKNSEYKTFPSKENCRFIQSLLQPAI